MPQTNHKRLQRLVEDEIGMRPKLQTCANIIRDAPPKSDAVSWEEWLARVWIANKAQLIASAVKRSTQQQSEGTEKKT